jgi:hypothetical protein
MRCSVDPGRALGAALHSVMAQTHRDFEVIVIDDGSLDGEDWWPDGTEGISYWLKATHGPLEVQEIQSSRPPRGEDSSLLLVEQRPCLSCVRRPGAAPGRGRNEAIARARGRFIAFLSPWHVWLPRKLERQLAYFARHPEAGLLHSAAIISRNPAMAALEATDDSPLDWPAASTTDQFAGLFHGQVEINTSTVMMPVDVIRERGGFDERWGSQAQDWDLWLGVAARHPVGFIGAPLAVCRPGPAGDSFENTYRDQELVIAQTESLCATSCRQHAGAQDACMRESRHRLYSHLGRERLRHGRPRDARAAYVKAMKMRHTDLRSCAYLAASWLGSSWARRMAPAGRAGQSRRTNLIQDTIYQRARGLVARTVHAVDDLVYRMGRADCHVLFQAASPVSLAIARPVLERLERDPRVGLWFTTADQTWNAGRVFHAAGIVDRVVSASEVQWMKFDAYLNTDFWNMTWLRRRTRRVHMFHGVAGKYGLDAPVRIGSVVASFDRLMFPNRDRLMRYEQAGLVDPDGERAALVGYPKVDCLVDGSLDRQRIGQSIGLDPTLPTVLYAPTWSPYASLNLVGQDVIAALANLGINVIVKIHDRSYDRTANGPGGVDWWSRMEELCRSHPNLRVARTADATPYLFVSDVLVTDHSSVGFEFMLLDRPIVVIDCQQLLEKARINPDRVRELRSAADATVEPSAESVASAVTRALIGPSRPHLDRRTVARRMFYRPGSATARAVQCMYDLLTLSVLESDQHDQKARGLCFAAS